MKTAEPVSAAAAARVRRLTPLAGLAARGAGEEVDTVGLLLLATAPVPDGPGRLSRSLYLGDATGAVLCVRWTHGAHDPPPRVRLGEAVSVRDAALGHATRFEPPQGSERFARQGALLLHFCEANVLGSRAALLRPHAVSRSHAAERSPHLRPHADELQRESKLPETRRLLAELAALCSLAYRGRLRTLRHPSHPPSPRAPSGAPPSPRPPPPRDAAHAAGRHPDTDPALRSHVEALLRERGGATLAQLAAASAALGADAAAVRRALDGMQVDCMCFVIAGEYRLL
uniref:Uncharacterized protein n=2 Tax=Emiliania huxleyi TaxID=2903 RepID=A0A7S3TVJ0_EMIHU